MQFVEHITQPTLFESPLKQLAEELASLDPNNMTPMEALEKLGKMRENSLKLIDS